MRRRIVQVRGGGHRRVGGEEAGADLVASSEGEQELDDGGPVVVTGVVDCSSAVTPLGAAAPPTSPKSTGSSPSTSQWLADGSPTDPPIGGRRTT